MTAANRTALKRPCIVPMPEPAAVAPLVEYDYFVDRYHHYCRQFEQGDPIPLRTGDTQIIIPLEGGGFVAVDVSTHRRPVAD